MNDKWKMIEIKDQAFIPFEWMDQTPGGSNLGHAEFQMCVKFRRGKVKEFWVYPRQQRDQKNCWHCQSYDRPDFTISSYEGLPDSHVWRVTYCKEHKTLSFHVYVPPNARYLKIDDTGISFCKTDWNAKEKP